MKYTRTLSWLAATALAVTLNAILAPAARASYALSFNGSNNYVNLTLTSPPASNYTISAWVFLRTGGTVSANLGVLSGACGSTIEFLIHSSTANATDPQYLELGRCNYFYGTNSGTPVPLNAWTHVAVTVSATRTVSYFINGGPAGTWTNAALDFSLGTNVNLGDNVVRRFNGMLDNVQIWNRTLSQSEIQTYMSNPLTGNESGLYAYYPFGEGSGATTADIAAAHGGSAGTLINSPAWVTNTPTAPTGVTPVSYWRMGEDDPGVGGFPTNTTDPTGGRTITLVGGSLYSSSSVSPVAAAHTGSDWCMQFFPTTYGTAALIPTLTDNFGIELWVQPNETTAQTCLAYNGNTGTSGWGLYKFGASYQGLFGGVANIGSGPVTANAWTHLALVRNNGTTTLYVNGVAAGSTTAAPIAPTGSFAVAANPQNPANDRFGGSYGYLDEVRVFTFPPGAFSVNYLLLNKPAAPTVTVLPATGLTATNATLNGTVNPNGLTTTAYIQWGLTTNYGNIGSFQSLGAGTAALAMSNGVSYISGPAGTFWKAQTNAPAESWYSVASSADGTELAAVNFGTQIYTSTNSGVTWTPRDSNRNWFGVASSADGTKLAADVIGGQIYTSTNSGVTWTPRDSNRNWFGVASSADGAKLVAVDGNPGYIYTSTDSGVTWTPRDSNRNWQSVASSADGTKLAAVVYGGQIYTSTDSGVTWTPRDSNRQWQSVASAADGTKLAAVVYNTFGGGQIYTSTDSGVTWTAQANAPSTLWFSVASAADGTRLAAVDGSPGLIYTSTDSGVHWTAQANAPADYWNSVASSADGTRVAAVVRGGQIYTSSGATSNLTPGTTYHYQLVGINSVGTTLGADMTFTTAVAAPAVTTLAASNITTTNATLNGTANPNGAATTAYFQYGLTTSYGSFSVTNTLAATNVNLSVSNLIRSLSPGAAYHFQLVGINSAGAMLGADMTLTTAVAVPAVTTLGASSITATNATLNGTVNPGGGVTTAYFQYGLTTNYGSFTATNTLAATNVNLSVSDLIGSLSPDTTYHFQLVGSNSAGTSQGVDMTFTTAVAAPAVTTLAASSITATNATLNATANPNGAATSAYFRYGLTTNYGSFTATNTLAATNVNLSVSDLIGSLSPGTTCHFQLVGINSAGATLGADKTFTTVAVPAVTTLAASSITATNATLNGTVNPGGGVTTAYFQYGLTTNYGSFTATNTLAATNVNLSLSNLIGSLSPVTTYHFQLVGINSAGATLGADQTFTSVPLPPVVATLPASGISATNATLNATVNPNGLTTTAYIEWGPTANYGNIGSLQSLGAGTAALAMSNGVSFISGLAGVNWTAQTGAPDAPWTSVASSADGTKLVAVSYGGQIYTSTDSGVTWTPRGGSTLTWQSVASSADGTKLVAVALYPYIYTSTNSGVTWTAQTGAPSTSWQTVASSADGTKLVAAAPFDHSYIYTSTNSGVNWTARTSAPPTGWSSFASSADGTKLVALDGSPGYIYTSTDSGVTWTARTSAPSTSWQSVASSADGTKLVALDRNVDQIYTSTDSGVTWTAQAGSPSTSWQSVASSADGTKLAAVGGSPGYIYTSTDSGVSWETQSNSPVAAWQSVASSADGTKLAAVPYGMEDPYSIPGEEIETSSGATSNLTPGTTYHFRCVGINYAGTTLGADMTFTTAAVAPAVTTLAASSITATNATLNGIVNPGGGVTTAYFQYGLTTNYGSFTATNTLAANLFNLFVSDLIGSLSPGTTYHFQLVGVNSVGATLGADQIFTSAAAAPTVTTLTASNITATNATLNGTANPNGAATTAYFQYGLTTSYGSFSVTNTLAATNVNLSVSNLIRSLSPGAAYHFQLVGINSAGAMLGADMTLTTAVAVPAVTTLGASSITATNATLNGTVNPGGGVTTAYFQYGLTTNYGSFTATNTLAATNVNLSVSDLIGSLSPGTTYHFQLVGINSAGATPGADKTFATVAFPAVTTLAASSITATNATLNGTVNPGGGVTTAYFQYGLTTNYGSFTATNTLAATNVNLSVSDLIGSLSPGTTYHFQLVGINSAGATPGADKTFTTVAVPAVTTLAASSITATNATLNGIVNPGGGVTTAYFQYGLTTNYGSFSATNTLAATNVNLSLSNLIGSLSPVTTYHFQLVGINSAGTTLGADMTVTTAVAAPAVTTLAASGISTTNATLNGTVNPGNGPTTAYFQYGLTTNYGSFSATNALAATNTTLSVSNLISSLSPGTTYHFQLVGINSAGATLGADQTFTSVPLPPVVATLPASGISATNATLNGTVNPGNGATTAYFQYGLDTNYGNIGSLASLPATNATLALASAISFLSGPAGTNWTAQTNAPNAYWNSVASSADGTKLVAVNGGVNNSSGYIYTSTNSGVTWTAQNNAPTVKWNSVASSADGTKLVAAVVGPSTDYIYTSTNSGVTWTGQINSPDAYWYSVASSADGTKLVAVVNSLIYTSTDSGVTWTAQTNAPSTYWSSVASSADGSRLAAVIYGDLIYTSTDSGVTWTAQTNAPFTYWYSVASSADGTKLVAVDNAPGYIYTSTDSGVTWTAQTNAPSTSWISVASSADGTKLVAADVSPGYIYTSTDSGVTWAAQTNAPSTYWYSVASSADGTKLVAGDNSPGLIYTSSGITSNLTPGTTYHYQLVGINSAGTALGADMTFTTVAAPVVTTLAASGITATNATLHGTVNPSGGVTTAYFQYGLTTNYGSFSGTNTLAATNVNLSVSNLISSLSPATTYHFRGGGVNSAGGTLGTDMTFTTAVAAQPAAFTLKGAIQLAGGAFQLSFTNLSGLGFTVFASTNVAAPFNTWSNLGPAVEAPASSGQYQFTDPQATNKATQFYRVRWP